jgi:hypothetical protein
MASGLAIGLAISLAFAWIAGTLYMQEQARELGRTTQRWPQLREQIQEIREGAGRPSR